MNTRLKSALGVFALLAAGQAGAQVRFYEGEAFRGRPLPPVAGYAYRQRPNERVFQAEVTSVRAVMERSEQRSWLERQQVNESGTGGRNVGGAIAGAILGGVLGHQIGGGRAQDIATAGGAVGSGVGRGSATR